MMFDIQVSGGSLPTISDAFSVPFWATIQTHHLLGITFIQQSLNNYIIYIMYIYTPIYVYKYMYIWCIHVFIYIYHIWVCIYKYTYIPISFLVPSPQDFCFLPGYSQTIGPRHVHVGDHLLNLLLLWFKAQGSHGHLRQDAEVHQHQMFSTPRPPNVKW